MPEVETSPLYAARIYTVLPAEDSGRALHFWRDTVGLRVREYEEQPGYFSAYAGDGTEILVYQRERTKAEHTVAGFRVHDIHEAVEWLRERGVVFQTYDVPGVTMRDFIADNGPVWSAWFLDTEGNIIGVTQEK